MLHAMVGQPCVSTSHCAYRHLHLVPAFSGPGLLIASSSCLKLHQYCFLTRYPWCRSSGSAEMVSISSLVSPRIAASHKTVHCFCVCMKVVMSAVQQHVVFASAPLFQTITNAPRDAFHSVHKLGGWGFLSVQQSFRPALCYPSLPHEHCSSSLQTPDLAHALAAHVRCLQALRQPQGRGQAAAVGLSSRSCLLWPGYGLRERHLLQGGHSICTAIAKISFSGVQH